MTGTTAAGRTRLAHVPAQLPGTAQAQAQAPASIPVPRNGGIVPMSLRAVHFVMPGGVDDPAAPSGGNAYDRRVRLDLPGFGDVAERAYGAARLVILRAVTSSTSPSASPP